MPEKYEEQFGKKIIGKANEKERAAAKKELEELFLEGSKEAAPYEMAKTEKDKQIIRSIESGVDKLIKLCGGKPKPLPMERIHLLRPGGVGAILGGESTESFHDILSYRVVLDRLPSDVATAVGLGHEIFHIKSHKSVQAAEDESDEIPLPAEDEKEKVKPYRSGLSILDREKDVRYLSGLDEAITAELNYHLFQIEIKTNPLYREELKGVDKIKIWIKRSFEKNGIDEQSQISMLSGIYTIIGAEEVLKVLEGDKSDDYKIDYIYDIIMREPQEQCRLIMFERPDDWRELNNLMREILEKSNGEFKNTQEIFLKIAEPKFTGKLSPLRRMIERILGKGSFRKVMERFKTYEG